MVRVSATQQAYSLTLCLHKLAEDLAGLIPCNRHIDSPMPESRSPDQDPLLFSRSMDVTDVEDGEL